MRRSIWRIHTWLLLTFRSFSLLSALNVYIRGALSIEIRETSIRRCELLSEFRKGVDMSGRNDFLPGSARSILTAELMAFPDVKVRRSNKELFGKGFAAFFHVVGSYTPSTFHQILSRWPPSRWKIAVIYFRIKWRGHGNYIFIAFYCVARKYIVLLLTIYSICTLLLVEYEFKLLSFGLIQMFVTSLFYIIPASYFIREIVAFKYNIHMDSIIY